VRRNYGASLLGCFVQVFDLDGDGNLEAMRLVE